MSAYMCIGFSTRCGHLSLFIIFLLFERTNPLPNKWDGWTYVQQGQFPAIVSVRGRGREHICMGVLIQSNYILTTASCIEIVGTNPIVVIGPSSIADDRWTQGVQEVRIGQADIHPKWTQKIEFGFDAALLKLPVVVDVQSPELVSENFDLYPNSRIYGFHLSNTLQVAQFDVVGNEVCPQLEGLGSETFCAFSKWASMRSGDSGGPFFVEPRPVLSKNQNSVYSKGMQAVQIVGIASFANYSSLNKSAARGVLISDIHSWIKQITDQQEKYDLFILHHLDDKQMIMAAATALILLLAIAVWSQAIPFFGWIM